MDLMVVTEDGQWVSESFMRLAEVINDYDSMLALQWIPPGQRTEVEDKKNPYRVIDTRSDYIVMYASERDTPESILARLWSRDNGKGNVLDRIEAENEARKALDLKKQMDDEELKQDFVAHLIATKKNYIHTTNPLTGEKLKLDDQLRRI